MGQTVFAVYPGGVSIFIDDQLKAAGGGFTVGRLNTGKVTGVPDNFLSVHRIALVFTSTKPVLMVFQ